MDPKVDAFLDRAQTWQDEMRSLRAIALGCGLQETLKWGKPCYVHDGENIASIQPFKARCGFMFFKGALLKDPKGLLEAPGPNSRIARRLMFSSMADVDAAEAAIDGFIRQAVEAAEAGLDVEVGDGAEPMPTELDAMFSQVPGLEDAFGALTPGRQRAYLLHFGGAKKSETRTRRVERCIDRILAGKGLDD